eukprot:2154818-Pleurochrysis_carterae.AAC.1
MRSAAHPRCPASLAKRLMATERSTSVTVLRWRSALIEPGRSTSVLMLDRDIASVLMLDRDIAR